MDKKHILDEIRRTAVDGKPLGRDQFCAQTGIREHDWLGKHWARWGDAQIEAGFEPLSFNSKFEDEYVLECIAQLAVKLGSFPTIPEMRLERRKNPEFPSDSVIGRRWNRAELIQRMIQFCGTEAKHSDVLVILNSTIRPAKKSEVLLEEPLLTESGYVYLIQAQGAYKIGCTRAPYRRAAEIANQSANGADLLHLISTDDPEGIEQYWHGRFSTKRLSGVNKQSGEWFALKPEDVKIFKRRKFM